VCDSEREEKWLRAAEIFLRTRLAENNSPHAEEGNTVGCRFYTICARGVLFFINAPLLWPTKVSIHSSGERQKAPKERENNMRLGAR
jgi:hypothetical protein